MVEEIAAKRQHNRGQPEAQADKDGAEERLAAGPDLRFDPGHWWLPLADLLGFVPVPAGSFLMGSEDLTDDEKPQHEVELPPFWTARVPTTVAQFRAFTEQSGYQDFDPAALRSPDHHPVVYVNWSDALQYCAWLQGELAEFAKQQGQSNPLWQGLAAGHLVLTLSSEAEWEKTARGTDGRIYPWGDEFDPRKANIDETGIGTTSPVGSFPSGASPYGALDMVGNVWEWTRSIYGQWDPRTEAVARRYTYPYTPHDGREGLTAAPDLLRVIRGASWAHDRVDTPCAYRGWELADVRCDSIGFRVVVSNHC
jgi:formylglycine-generating enzyme required for sulfatase activity